MYGQNISNNKEYELDIYNYICKKGDYINILKDILMHLPYYN